MKKHIFLAIAAIMLCTGLQAQSLWDASKPDNNFTFGVRAGLDFASSDMEYATSTKTGFHAGAIVDYNIVKSLSIESGVSFVNKGFKSSFGKGHAGYIQVPLLASYRIETPTKVQIHFNVGGYFAWGVSGKVDYAPYDETFAYDFHQDSFGKKGFFKHFDAGLSAGAYIVVSHLLFGISYEYGLADIAKVYGKFHNRNVAVTLGYNL